MAAGFLALFDDIAVLMDDVAAMSKLATQKTAGILADDLAVNAEKASGFVSKREIPVLWRIAKGSFLSKLIILPVAFLLSAYAKWVIVPILLIGGTYLAFEGVEKIIEYFFHKKEETLGVDVSKMSPAEAKAYEDKKVKAAILVDFILSIEIVFIALSTVADQPLNIQIPVVTVVAILATIGVYGLVALLVRMDDVGYRLIARSNGESGFAYTLGNGLVKTLPILVRALGVIGTIAMILVGGGIFVHNIHAIHDLLHGLPGIVAELLTGLVVGLIAVVLFEGGKKLLGK